MTRDTPCPVGGGVGGHVEAELDLLKGLWEQAPFARLPIDAPAELRDLVEDIENPRRVYAIHRASRRHNFQQLVQKYIVQLREGCGTECCSTPTCFTCRKRIVGKAPVRRYNPTSARTLAIYLASQENPESGLCPTLKPPKSPPAALMSLGIWFNKPQPRDDTVHRGATGQNGETRNSHVKARSGDASPSLQPPEAADTEPTSAAPPLDTAQAASQTVDADITPRTLESHEYSIRARPVQKDYRSFTANMFETVAFKMLEWLTPSAINELVRETSPYEEDEVTENQRKRTGRTPECQGQAVPRAKRQSSIDVLEKHRTADHQSNPVDTVSKSPESTTQEKINSGVADSTGEKEPLIHSREALSGTRPLSSRRNSKATVRTASAPKPKRRLSIDAYAQEGIPEDPLSGMVRSPLLGSHTEKTTRSVKPGNGIIPRPISQLTTAGYFDDVSLGKMPGSKAVDVKPKLGRSQMDGTRSSGPSSPKESTAGSGIPSDASSDKSWQIIDTEGDTPLEDHYPQALSRLNADAVDFICDVLQDYGVAEKHMLHPKTIKSSQVRQAGQAKSLKRLRSRSRRDRKPDLRREWTLFSEQTIFYVLSDSGRVVRSFNKKGALYDSQTMWYCMLRLTRVAPTLVFHSLWLAAASLFAPPISLQSSRSPTAKLFPRHRESLSNDQAGCLLSICLHALVAAAPLLSDSSQLYDLSRIRSHGLSLAGSGAIARQPVEVCLQYDDAFANNLALRLARRLFSAITTRRSFDELNLANLGPGDKNEPDILDSLFSQLDFLNMDAAYILNFSVNDRALHETRVPTLLLDWARAVMLQDWDGNPEVPGDGPFGGALALIDAVFKKRQTLLLGDTQFRSEYFAERLDAVDMPVAWISHVSTKRKLHLLDFPFMFSPSTLVSYFRSINFSRMSRAYEEASSLNGRIKTIMSQGNLIMQTRHKKVLHEMLTTASSRYLVLTIDRDNVIKDSFDQLWRREERELLRPLKVHLGEGQGEEGFDSGGVQQEFFRLAVAEALDPSYGAFTVDDRTRMVWFRSSSPEELWKYELTGLLVSLAVYNGLTLPVTFPKALYRKLVGEPVTELHHIADGWPDLASGLTQLLEWDEKDGSVEEIFARTYEFSVESFDQPITRIMKSNKADEEPWPQFPKTSSKGGPSSAPPHTANPDDAPLITSANRNAYVYDYIRYLTDVSVRPQYEAFSRGFRTCFHPKSLTLLTSNILQSLVEGVQEVDVSELRRYARYVSWDASHRSVKDFWSIVKRYDDRMKRKLLEFVTASDRLPVGGVKNLNFIIQRNGIETGEGGHLPTAYTCYGTLLLPEYKDKEVLRERLSMALENAQGFGFA